MTTETFDVAAAPAVRLTACTGTLTVDVGEAGRYEVESAAESSQAAVGDDGRLQLEGMQGDLRLRVPAETALTIVGHRGDMEVRGIGATTLDRIDGDIRIGQLSGALHAQDLNGDLVVDGATSLVLEDGPQPSSRWDRRGVKRVDVRNVAVVTIENVGRDLSVTDGQTVTVRNVGAKCTIRNVREAFHGEQIGHDLIVEGQDSTVVVAQNIGGELRCSACQSVEVENVGGNARVQNITGDTEIGAIGGNCTVEDIAGPLKLGAVGGNAHLRGKGTLTDIGPIGGSLTLDGVTFQIGAPDGRASLTVGGNARIELPPEPNLTIHATVGGSVWAEETRSSGGGMATLVYGEGASHLHVTAGGNVELRGGGTPRMKSSIGGGWSGKNWKWSDKDWNWSGRDWERFGEELGRRMEGFGEEFGRRMEGFAEQFGAAFADRGERWGTSSRSDSSRRSETSEPAATAEAPSSVATSTGAEERIAVLRMIAVGRITADEGERLPNALS